MSSDDWFLLLGVLVGGFLFVSIQAVVITWQEWKRGGRR